MANYSDELFSDELFSSITSRNAEALGIIERMSILHVALSITEC